MLIFKGHAFIQVTCPLSSDVCSHKSYSFLCSTVNDTSTTLDYLNTVYHSLIARLSRFLRITCEVLQCVTSEEVDGELCRGCLRGLR